MLWIVLSPHLDDAVYSCGGLITKRLQARGQVEIWTLFAGAPLDGQVSRFTRRLQCAWGLGSEPIAGRRREDENACRSLGAVARHYPFLDAVYRCTQPEGTPLYTNLKSLFAPFPESDMNTVSEITAKLWHDLPPAGQLVAPLAPYRHVDHRMTLLAAEEQNRSVLYYEDVLYTYRTPDPAACGYLTPTTSYCFRPGPQFPRKAWPARAIDRLADASLSGNQTRSVRLGRDVGQRPGNL